ncbi:MAG: hypothetical protein NT165_00020 [Candidatus Falkowbacteria bacterium]|nr:hypothetical protein [Candidatus Falkowbacteria bacterium]
MNYLSVIFKYRKPLFTGLVFCVVFLFLPIRAQASSNENVRGYARLASSNTYISFNCVDDNGGGRFPFNFPIHFSASGCLANPHGVNIDNSGNFSGKAWHYIFGDINFELNTSTAEQTKDDDFRTNCPSCLAANGCSACVVKTNDGTPGIVYGYARVNNFATNSLEGYGWIKLDGISIDSFNSDTPGGFKGFVDNLNAPASIGAIAFDCHDDMTCTSDVNNLNWHAYVWSLWVGRMTAPNWPYDMACDYGARGAILKWQLSSGTQKKWQIIISPTNSLNTTSPYFTVGSDDGLNGDATTFGCLSSDDNCFLNYGTSYYWWLKLWYSFNDSDPESAWIQTPWIQFDHSATDNIGRVVAGTSLNNKDFATYMNEFPYIASISATPTVPLIGTSSFFTAIAYYSTPGQPTSNISCDDGNCAFHWSSNDSNAVFSPWNSPGNTTSAFFVHPTGTTVSVRVVDGSGYSCRIVSGMMNANFTLPLWREVKVKKNAQ